MWSFITKSSLNFKTREVNFETKYCAGLKTYFQHFRVFFQACHKTKKSVIHADVIILTFVADCFHFMVSVIKSYLLISANVRVIFAYEDRSIEPQRGWLHKGNSQRVVPLKVSVIAALLGCCSV